MKKTLHFFFLRIALPNLLIFCGFFAVILTGALLPGVPQGRHNLFHAYYESFSMVFPFLASLLPVSMSSTYLNLALSLGARRSDCFRAFQWIMVILTLMDVLLYQIVLAVPVHFSWSGLENWVLLPFLREQPVWGFFLLCLCFNIFGCVAGLILARSKSRGMTVVVAFSLLMSGLLLLMIFTAKMKLSLWDNLAGIILLAMVAGAAASEWYIWKNIKTFIVR